jgi:hypothetical protein
MNANDTNAANARAEADAGRDAGGRFKAGNKGGPGNPFGGLVALMRAAILQSVTTLDIAEIIQTLVAMAKDGNLSAAKLVLSYTIGKPQPFTDDDFLLGQRFAAELMPSTNGERSAEPSPNGDLPEEPSTNDDFRAEEAPSPNGDFLEAPSPNGDFVAEPSPNGVLSAEPPSPNGVFGALEPKLNRQQRRALRLAKKQRNTPIPAATMRDVLPAS